MSYEFYRILHLIAIFAILLSLGAMTIYMSSGATRASFKARKFVGMIHGIALLVTIVAGFGLLAKLGLSGGLPGWVLVKLVIWLALGALPAVIYKKPNHAKSLFALTWFLAAVATVLAITKPL